MAGTGHGDADQYQALPAAEIPDGPARCDPLDEGIQLGLAAQFAERDASIVSTLPAAWQSWRSGVQGCACRPRSPVSHLPEEPANETASASRNVLAPSPVIYPALRAPTSEVHAHAEGVINHHTAMTSKRQNRLICVHQPSQSAMQRKANIRQVGFGCPSASGLAHSLLLLPGASGVVQACIRVSGGSVSRLLSDHAAYQRVLRGRDLYVLERA